MNPQLIAHTWFALGERQGTAIDAFYERLFGRFPRYRSLFPPQLDRHQMHKMVETMSLVARLGEDRPLIAPRIHRLGDHHQPYRLGQDDLANFREVFVEVFGEHCGFDWSDAAASSWREAFDQVIIPLMMKGNER